MNSPVPFVGSAASPSPGDRLLLVSYHFPPGRAIGALRWSRLANHLAAQGRALDVITLAPESLASLDPSTLTTLPSSTRVFGAKSQPGWLESLEMLRTSRARARAESPAERAAPSRPRVSSLGPDEIARGPLGRAAAVRAYGALLHRERDLSWARAAKSVGAALVARVSYEAVVSCGPPHAAHLAAAALARRAGKPLVIDLRDPWATRRRLPAAYASPIYFWLADRDERRAGGAARLIIANTDELRADLSARYPSARVITILNGYDDEPVPVGGRSDRFLVAYAGSIYLDRDPRPLFAGFARLVRARDLTPNDAGLEFMGSVASYAGASLGELAAGEGIDRFVRVHAAGSRNAARCFLASAAVLVSLPQDSPFAIPSKVFEYMDFPAWLLALADATSPTARLLAGTGADVARPGDPEAIGSVLIEKYDRFVAGERPGFLKGREPFSRRHQAERLVHALDALNGLPAGSSGPATGRRAWGSPRDRLRPNSGP